MTKARRCLSRLWPVVLFVLAWSFLFAFHRYNLWDMVEGWVISDEGHQLYQPLRWLSGQWFYRDFTTDNYPPGMITLHAGLYQLFGVRMSVLRLWLTLVGAGIAALGYLLARKIMPAGFALVAYLLCLTWNVTSLNIGFPSWDCVLLGLAAVWLVLRYEKDGRLGWLALAGALTGVSAAFKVTQGVYQWLGLALFLAWQSAGRQPRRRWTVEQAFALASALFGLALLRSFPTAMNLLLFGLPLAALAGAILLRRSAGAQGGKAPFLVETGVLALGAGLVTLVWVVPTILELGWALFLEGTFLAPLRHSSFMRAVVRPPTLNGWLLLVWGAGAGLALWRCRRISLLAALGYAASGVALLFVPLGQDFTAREALRTGFQAWRELRFFLLLIAGGALAALAWRRALPAEHRPVLFLYLAYGSWNLYQIYPFADSNHLLWSVQPGFILLAYLLGRGWEATRQKMDVQSKPSVASRMAALPAGLLPAALVALQLYPFLGHFYKLDSGLNRVHYELLDPPRADVYVREDAARTLRSVGRAIVAQTTPADTIFDTSGSFFYFLTGRHNATRHDFIWPGFLTEAEIAGLIRDLQARRPALVIWRETDEHVVGSASFREAFPQIAAAIEREYAPAQRIGEYALWSRRR